MHPATNELLCGKHCNHLSLQSISICAILVRTPPWNTSWNWLFIPLKQNWAGVSTKWICNHRDHQQYVIVLTESEGVNIKGKQQITPVDLYFRNKVLHFWVVTSELEYNNNKDGKSWVPVIHSLTQRHCAQTPDAMYFPHHSYISFPWDTTQMLPSGQYFAG